MSSYHDLKNQKSITLVPLLVHSSQRTRPELENKAPLASPPPPKERRAVWTFRKVFSFVIPDTRGRLCTRLHLGARVLALGLEEAHGVRAMTHVVQKVVLPPATPPTSTLQSLSSSGRCLLAEDRAAPTRVRVLPSTETFATTPANCPRERLPN